jgi:hypothetical protein
MQMKLAGAVGAVLLLVVLQVCPVGAQSDGVPWLTVEELRAMLQQSDLVIVDVRAVKDWKHSETKILGAVREDPDDVASWAVSYANTKTLVLYCA